MKIEKIKAEIKELRIEKKNAEGEKKKQLKTEILSRRAVLEDLILQEIADIQIDTENYKELTDKQKDFYLNIFDYLSAWVADKTKIYTALSWNDRRVPSKLEIKICIKRIGELLVKKFDKKSFTEIADTFYAIKNNGMYVIAYNHDHLKKDM